MKGASNFPSNRVIKRTYERAIEDEKAILKLWPDARGHKKEVTGSLGLSAAAVKWLRERGVSENKIEEICVAHQKALKEALPGLYNYRPSELIKANLHEAWTPYAALLLGAASLLEGSDFAGLSPNLAKLGFDSQILSYFRPAQKRKYFLQQTRSSVATMIVSRRHHRGIRSEEAVRVAQRRLYSRVRSKSGSGAS